MIAILVEKDPTFEPPQDWVPPKKFKKVWLPDDGTNYVGLLIGPGGKT